MLEVLMLVNTVGYPLFEGFWGDFEKRKRGKDY
jgi:uncharacterized membrane protein